MMKMEISKFTKIMIAAMSAFIVGSSIYAAYRLYSIEKVLSALQGINSVIKTAIRI